MPIGASQQAVIEPDEPLHLAAAKILLRLSAEVRALVDSPPFLRLRRASDELCCDSEILCAEYTEYHMRIGFGIEPSAEDYLNALTAAHVAAARFEPATASETAAPN
jgi:hypothetical protein